MIGFSNNHITIGIDAMPYRKKFCLVIQEGNSEIKYASFNNDEAAYEFMKKFAEFLGYGEIEIFGREKGEKDELAQER